MITTGNRNDLCDGTLSPAIHLQNLTLNQDGITQLFKETSCAFMLLGLVWSFTLFLLYFWVLFLLPPIQHTNTNTASKTLKSCIFKWELQYSFFSLMNSNNTKVYIVHVTEKKTRPNILLPHSSKTLYDFPNLLKLCLLHLWLIHGHEMI